MWGQLSTTCSNLLKWPNGDLLVVVNHNQLRTLVSETVDPIDWSHPPPSWAVPPERLVHSINQCSTATAGIRSCNIATFSMRGNHLSYAVTRGMCAHTVSVQCTVCSYMHAVHAVSVQYAVCSVYTCSAYCECTVYNCTCMHCTYMSGILWVYSVLYHTLWTYMGKRLSESMNAGPYYYYYYYYQYYQFVITYWYFSRFFKISHSDSHTKRRWFN